MSTEEKRWLLAWTGGLIALLLLPVIWGWLNPPEGWQLYRGFAYGEDYTQYRSAMVQGYDGAWLIENRFTPEPHTPALQYPLYVLLGHIARVLRLPVELPYLLAAILAAGALALALYDCAAAFYPEVRDRRLVLWLALVVGPGWLLQIVQALIPAVDFFTRYRNAFNRPEVNTFLVFSAAPHLPLSLAILLLSLACARRRQSPDTESLSALAFALYYVAFPVLLGLLNPFCLPVLLLPQGLWWFVRSVQARRILWREAVPLAVMGFAALPLVAYNAWTFSQDPFWGRAYGSQNYQISFPLDVVLMGYGVLGLLGIAGAIKGWRDAPSTRMLTLWAVILLLMGYIPVRYQRRFSFGLGPVLALLAVGGWHWAARTRPVRRWRHKLLTRVLFTATVVLLLWGQNLIYYSAHAMSFLGTGEAATYVFQPRALAEAADHIDAEQGEDAVVLTCEEVGNRLAGELHGRVVLGHPGATLDVKARREWVPAFFEPSLPPAEAQAHLEELGVTHIVVSDLEAMPCGPGYEPDDAWVLRFERGGIRVYARKALADY